MNKIKAIILLFSGIWILGGCSTMNINEDNESQINENENERTYNFDEKEIHEYLVPVQEYIGEGYRFRDSVEENLEVAEQHREVVETAVQEWFLDNHKTEVKINNIVSVVDGVAVFVESVGKPDFYTHVIVPIHIETGEVRTESIWASEGKVEIGIKGGLLELAFEEEFNNLNEYLESLTKQYPIVGLSEKAVKNVMGTGYTTPYYYLTPSDRALDQMIELYLQEQNFTQDGELDYFFQDYTYNESHVFFTINLYMKNKGDKPSEEIFNQILKDIEGMDDIPRGTYSILLHDNYIHKGRAEGYKENSLRRAHPNEIIKD
ncbi:DUF1672 family protein [Alkalihalobacillus trypoxylicola]|uniref:DUF1672 domain-containing protein n=1 Tax=Alkalihalobacillus trypoxylicola TaxID=519424 RepID=A0A162D0U7_9BACI|nr:DUF1672 family protein [Alkalihalobacillus trypoxylicola]KYG27636.1 hypothetical protein AZF04_10615 [Alkalihalobacillus trypoxylicola]